jgi:superfamily II DNA/RNA helicase
MSFEELGIKDEILRGIFSYGYEKPSDIQEKSIPLFNTGKDLIAQAQSGTGKTGSFCVGVLNNIDISLSSVQSIILCPTHELVHQCNGVITNINTYYKSKIITLVGKIPVHESITQLRTNPHVVIGTPGRVLDMMERNELYTNDIKNITIDEADEMLSSGFLETMYKIIRYIPKTTQICLFSATIPDSILELTDKFMLEPNKILVNKEQLTLEGIQQFYIKLDNYSWKYDVLIDLYKSISLNQCIIYVNSKKSLTHLLNRLSDDEFPVSHIHGELSSSQRKEEMDNFRSGSTRIMISTDLLSRGIDIQQLSLVINFDIPYNVETYIHRIGRSGRYGRKGVAINFILTKEEEDMMAIQTHYDTEIKEMPENIHDYLAI